jgi:hypothetical protein
VTMFNETDTYYSGNPEHHGKKRVYVANRRELLRMLHDHKVHCFSVDQRVEYLGEPTVAGHFRLKLLADQKILYADNHGIYRLQ